MLRFGSSYSYAPTVSVDTTSGSNAVLTIELQEFNTNYEVVGEVVKGGLGKGKGYWSTTRGFLNSDKYIQDSYYYQDFSYEIQTALTLDKYRDILYNTFHIAGNELFGKLLIKTVDTANLAISEETTSNTRTISTANIASDSSTINVDTMTITIDMSYISS